MRRVIVIGFPCIAIPGCLVGGASTTGAGAGLGDGEGGGGGSDPPSVTGTIDRATVTTELGKSETLNVTIANRDGFSGVFGIVPSMVDAAGNAVTGWTLTPTPATVDLGSKASAQVQLVVTVPTDAAVLTPHVKIGLQDGSGKTWASDMTAAFTVAKQLTIELPASGIAPPKHLAWPDSGQVITVRAGTKVSLYNADSVPHRIHGSNGVPHEPGDLAPGADYVVTPTVDGKWYCHSHESSANARTIKVIP